MSRALRGSKPTSTTSSAACAARGVFAGIVRPAFPDLEAKGEFLAAMGALGAGGVREIAFYNWGHLRDANLDWIAEGLAALERARRDFSADAQEGTP